MTAVDSLAIQRSLTLLEDRYRELREIGEKRHQAWEREKAELQQQLSDKDSALQDALSSKAELQQQLNEAKEEADLTLLQLHQVQEELEHYFLHSQELTRKNKKLKSHIDLLLRSRIDVKSNWRYSRSAISNKAFTFLGRKILSATYSH